MAYSLPPFFYKTNFIVYRGTDFHREENEEGEFELITVELNFSRRNGGFFSPFVNVGSTRINIYLCEVLTVQDSMVLALRDRLTELGVPADRHAIKIARLLDHISVEVINRSVERPVMVVMNIEQIGPLAARQQSSSIQVAELDDDDFLEEVREWVPRPPVWDAAAEDDDLNEAVDQSMEADVAKTTPASETAIDGLEKVQLVFTPSSCSICMDEEDKKEFARMPCAHLFHHDCIATWLRINAACPLCRFLMPTEEDSL